MRIAEDNSPELLASEGLGWDLDAVKTSPHLTLGLVRELAEELDKARATIHKINSYADGRAGHRTGTVGSLRIASDLYVITGREPLWDREKEAAQ